MKASLVVSWKLIMIVQVWTQLLYMLHFMAEKNSKQMQLTDDGATTFSVSSAICDFS